MDSLEFVKLAKSTEEYNLNLNYVYRDTDRFVATDGHRLHFAGAPVISNPHYLDTIDSGFTFPEYKLILPNGGTTSTLVITARDWIDYLPKIKGLKALCKAFNNYQVVFKHNNEGFKFEYQQEGVDTSLTFGKFKEDALVETIGVNLNYLLDAVHFQGSGKSVYGSVVLNFRGALTVIEIVSPFGTALIMPVRPK